MTRDLEWPSASLLPAPNLHFLTGDRGVVFSQAVGPPTSARTEEDPSSTSIKSVRVSGSAFAVFDGLGRSTWREPQPWELLLPVYAGHPPK